MSLSLAVVAAGGDRDSVTKVLSYSSIKLEVDIGRKGDGLGAKSGVTRDKKS